jgi:hypothetical protein
MSTTRKFWLWEVPEGEIYENLSWDLPGFRPVKGSRMRKPVRKRTPQK